ncbi:hypothetical protein BpHYR1_015894 [Brachionus plicatilis]|uniref:Uncharacterized protein n=1 Tax=Brachionus plicatilis TaxID=10195 RepID=A0A3M7Q1I3_BRAPC|nr:hypothetical protein BpHYR1_015894 [Brachionus plicatilis]
MCAKWSINNLMLKNEIRILIHRAFDIKLTDINFLRTKYFNINLQDKILYQNINQKLNLILSLNLFYHNHHPDIPNHYSNRVSFVRKSLLRIPKSKKIKAQLKGFSFFVNNYKRKFSYLY